LREGATIRTGQNQAIRELQEKKKKGNQPRWRKNGKAALTEFMTLRGKEMEGRTQNFFALKQSGSSIDNRRGAI